ncbi:MAG: DarT ssDNA thymidine ADP-ribosyltransferase family protein [Candidatus Aquilonibacter sp.]|jgi:hypothetical protein
MTIDEFVLERGIREVVHFTQRRGLLGICFTHALLPRSELSHEQLLEFILNVNAAIRNDKEWFDHVNLSINNINRRFFDASTSWHKGAEKTWWVILSFDPEILSHAKVWFATTNNGYPGVERQPGAAGLEAIYSEPITHGWSWPKHRRHPTTRYEDPTCPQAEALYPGRLSTRYLRRVYVPDEATYREASSFLTFLPNRRDLTITIEESRFSPFIIDPCKTGQ